MPELPEVETSRRGISPWMVDQRIEDITIRERRLRWPVPEAASGRFAVLCNHRLQVFSAQFVVFGKSVTANWLF